MFTKIRSITVVALALMIGLTCCKKKEYSFGDVKTPSNLVLTTAIVGADAANPTGDGSGKVLITVTSDNALTYNFDYGSGETATIPSGSIEYKYNTPGTNDYTITVNVVGTGGAISTISKTITVFVAFNIPAEIMSTFTNGSSRVFITDRDAPGHFGVGPADGFGPSYYAAPPNTREACAYDDEITFTKVSDNVISMTIDNKGESFSIGASSAFYGFGGGDGCYAVNTGGTRTLIFSGASSASTPAQSTRVQFKVPGNGIINFGTGGVTYEILEIGATTMHLRNIGADGNSWYQKLKVKP